MCIRDRSNTNSQVPQQIQSDKQASTIEPIKKEPENEQIKQNSCKQEVQQNTITPKNEVTPPQPASYLPSKGSFQAQDIPIKILQAKQDPHTKDIIFQIEWKQRSDGAKPLNSDVTNKDFRTYNQCEFLLNYYESKLKFCQNKQE
eukprot:TRINITY_DN13287_c0_g1_i2.p2 TRINITY_DN13287_c0_g1~~TRINITY_DN13287_c0_g1_i2.p2  ORF type:complete len:145 (+),score=28.07 TRINITY_DN13287_c0_g1_i2:164-598(+)